jgi:hypothetical protein
MGNFFLTSFTKQVLYFNNLGSVTYYISNWTDRQFQGRRLSPLNRRSWNSSVSVVTRLRAERPGFYPRKGLKFFLFAAVSRPSLGYTLPSIKWLGREADDSPPTGTEIKNVWGYTSAPPYVFMTWYLVTHKDNFTVTS